MLSFNHRHARFRACLSQRAGSSLKRLIAGSIMNRRQHVLSFVARCLVHLTRQRSSMKRALISKCRGVRFGRLCFLNASRCNWSMILFSTVACTESISTVRHTCVDVFLRRCSDACRGHVRRVGTDVLRLFACCDHDLYFLRFRCEGTCAIVTSPRATSCVV